MIAEEYQGAPEKVKARYNHHALAAMREAIRQEKELFAGLILGEAKDGRNYFDRWMQAPKTLF